MCLCGCVCVCIQCTQLPVANRNVLYLRTNSKATRPGPHPCSTSTQEDTDFALEQTRLPIGQACPRARLPHAVGLSNLGSPASRASARAELRKRPSASSRPEKARSFFDEARPWGVLGGSQVILCPFSAKKGGASPAPVPEAEVQASRGSVH